MRIKHIPVMLIAICAPALYLHKHSTSQDIEDMLVWTNPPKAGGAGFERPSVQGTTSIGDSGPPCLLSHVHTQSGMPAGGKTRYRYAGIGNTSNQPIWQIVHRALKRLRPGINGRNTALAAIPMMFSGQHAGRTSTYRSGAVLTPRN